jgi:serine/threonine protein kinase
MKEILANRYQIQQQLGKQLGRETLLALDGETNELVVVKLLKFHSDFDWEHLKLFEREAQILKTLNHPSIPRYLDYFEIDSSDYKGFALVQTYLQAKSLEQHREDGRIFTEDDVKKIAKSILEILTYLHNFQPPLIHRDIKPSNILLTDKSAHHIGDVYLVDFGSVQNVAAMEGGTFTIVGTYGYMPPEQFGGRAVPASDLYSLGATLVYLLTGKHPADLPQKEFQIQFEGIVNINYNLKIWLRKMLEPSLDKRFNSSNQARQSLENSLKTQNFGLVESSFLDPSKSQIRINKSLGKLEIIIPAKPLTTIGQLVSLLLVLLFLVPFITPIIVSLILRPLFFFIGSYWLISGLFFPISYLSLLVFILMGRFSTLKLSLTPHQITYRYKFLNLEFNYPFKNLKSPLTSLKILGKNPAQINNKKAQQLPQNILIFFFKNDRRIIYNLTSQEADWLGNEISNWLGIPLTSYVEIK